MQYAYSYQTIPDPSPDRAWEALNRAAERCDTTEQTLELLDDVLGGERVRELVNGLLGDLLDNPSNSDSAAIDRWYARGGM